MNSLSLALPHVCRVWRPVCRETGVLEVEQSLDCVPRSSNTPLWSLIPAETGGLSWLGEVNRLVCVTESQVATVLLDGGCVYSSCYPWGCCALGATMSLPLLGSVVGGGAGE